MNLHAFNELRLRLATVPEREIEFGPTQGACFVGLILAEGLLLRDEEVPNELETKKLTR